MAARFRFTVSDEHSGKRVDQIIAAQVPELSRGRAKAALAEGGVFVDRKRVKVASRILGTGQKVEVNLLEEVASPATTPADVTVPIIEKNDDFLIVDKPSGLFSAPTPESDRHDLLFMVTQQLKKDGLTPTLHLIHRLDRPTSGLMVLARNRQAAAELSDQVSRHVMSRNYLAVLVGELANKQKVEEPLAQKSACTHFAPQELKNGLSLVSATLETGRTHQVRLHAEHIGMPVAGDSKYGRRIQRGLQPRPPRLALHAHRLKFRLPGSGKWCEWESAWPMDLSQWWDNSPHAPSPTSTSAPIIRS